MSGQDLTGANARLIAAAPTMLDALKTILEVKPVNEGDGDDPELDAAYEKVRAAIAEAGAA